MRCTLDLSGNDDDGKAGIDRAGGLFLSVEDAVAHGKMSATTGLRGRYNAASSTTEYLLCGNIYLAS